MVANCSQDKPKQIHPIVVLHERLLLFLAEACWQFSIEHLGSRAHVVCSEEHKGRSSTCGFRRLEMIFVKTLLGKVSSEILR